MKRTYGRLALEGQWSMTGLAPHAAIALKRMFPKIPKGSKEPFTFADRPDVAEELRWFMARYPMMMRRRDVDHLLAASNAHRRTVEEVEDIMRPDWGGAPDIGRGFRSHVKLHPNQVRNIAVATKFGRLLVMDDLGLGKTITGFGCLLEAKAFPAAIIVQPHLTSQWAERAAEFTGLKVHIIRGTQPYPLPRADVYIFAYTRLAGWVDVVTKHPFAGVIFDEIQDIRAGATTAKGRAAQAFTANARLRVGLSATPIYNYGGEIHFVMDLLDPGCLGTWAEFTEEWCRFNGKKYIVVDPPALGSYLSDRHLVTRHRKTGSPVNQIIVTVDHDDAIEAKEMAFAKVLAQRVVSGTFTERGQAARELDMLARRVTGLAKAKSVAAYVRILIDAGEPVILAGWHRDVYDVWLKELKDKKPLLYTGTETQKQKDATKRAFISGDTDLMILSLRSGAGLDGLQKRCAFVVFGELDWSPKVHEQLIGRVDRPGQTRDVTAIFCVSESGSDPLIQGVLGLKDSQSRGIVDPLQGTVTIHSDESRLRLLAQAYLEKEAA